MISFTGKVESNYPSLVGRHSLLDFVYPRVFLVSLVSLGRLASRGPLPAIGLPCRCFLLLLTSGLLVFLDHLCFPTPDLEPEGVFLVSEGCCRGFPLEQSPIIRLLLGSELPAAILF